MPLKIKRLPTKKVEPKTITNLTSFFEILERDKPISHYLHSYRGHPDATYILQPSLFRKKEHRRDEKNILRELISIQPNEFRDDRSVFEQLVRMQHYSLPTRLLDITLNPLVGLYFTCSHHPKKDAEFVRLSFRKSDMKYFDSDTVSCIANLSNLSGRQRDQIRSMNTSEQLADNEIGEKLLHFIKAEKSYFLPKIQIDDLSRVVPVKPKQTNRRIIAQQGAFLLFGLKSVLADDNDFGIGVKKTLVEAKYKAKILDELDGININPSTIFPEIESAAKYIMSKLTPVEGSFERDE